MLRNIILQAFCNSGGKSISGGKLAKRLGVSRVAVWKHIEALKEEGYDIVGVSGKGYIMKDAGKLLCPIDLPQSLPTLYVAKELRHYGVVESTNRLARRMFEAGEIDEGCVILADKQTEGRGRRGRKWESPSGGLWFSLILHPPLPIAEISLLPLVFAVAVAKGLDEYLDSPCQIKWPNDLYVKDRKIAGISLETSGELDHPDYVIAGIGINVNINSIDLPGETRLRATSLLEQGKHEYSIATVLKIVLLSLDHYYENFLKLGFAGILDEFKSRCFHLGHEVIVSTDTRKLTGTNTDIDYRGSLVLDTGFKLERLSTGDVKLINNQED